MLAKFSVSKSIVQMSIKSSAQGSLVSLLKVLPIPEQQNSNSSDDDHGTRLPIHQFTFKPWQPENQESVDGIQAAAELLKSGEGLIAMPTETVYGLAANAHDESAVSRIFKLKGRPTDNPLIVHIASWKMLDDALGGRERASKILASLPPRLLESFWPGPLTVLFPNNNNSDNNEQSGDGLFPGIVTCGQRTVAIRWPSHPIAQRLILESGVPVAAPSANLSGHPSPTLAEHVLYDFQGRMKQLSDADADAESNNNNNSNNNKNCDGEKSAFPLMIVDGGPCAFGLESTVLDPWNGIILRPGAIGPTDLQPFFPDRQLLVYKPSVTKQEEEESKTQSRENNDDSVRELFKSLEKRPNTPGMKYRHYSPKAPLFIISTNLGLGDPIISSKLSLFNRIGLFTINNTNDNNVNNNISTQLLNLNKEIITFDWGNGPWQWASNLFKGLRYLDENVGVEVILVPDVSGHCEQSAPLLALLNRLEKAASKR